MRKPLIGLLFVLLLAAPALGQVPLAKRIGHYAPITTPPSPRPPGQPGPHQGVGALSLANLLDPKTLSGNWTFFQRGVLWPHSSIGEHFHLGTEEMFVILDADAEYTVDGRSA